MTAWVGAALVHSAAVMSRRECPGGSGSLMPAFSEDALFRKVIVEKCL